MTFRAVFGSLFVAVGAILVVNAFFFPIPGLEWARFDSGDKVATEANGAGSGRRGARGGGRWSADGPSPVTVAAATVDDVPVYLRGVGTAKALATVTVRPQVDGKLIKVHFREGQDVKRGDLLAEIDPVTYQAQLDQAVAKQRLTQVQLDNAEADLKRLTSVGAGVVTQKSVDTQRALVAQYEAQLKQDAASIANAEAVLGYTQIVSPIDGRTGQRLVDEGNLVRSGDAGIVTIAQIRPLSVQFTIPQQQLSDVNGAMARGPVPVEALAADDRTAIDSGILSFIDNQVDAATGTVRMKAEMPNERLQLWPGQFANVRVLIDTWLRSVTVPTASVQRGPAGAFVYVLAEAGDRSATVAMRPVVVAQQNERVSVISQGLKEGDRVVTSGFSRLKDGSKVTVSSSDTPANTKPAAQRTSQAPAGPGAAASPAAPDAAAPSATATAPAASSADGKPQRGERRRAEGEGRRERANPSVVQ